MKSFCLTWTASARNCSQVIIESIKDWLNVFQTATIAETGVDFSHESSCWSIVDMEQLGGGSDSSGGIGGPTVNGHDVVQAHLLNDQVIKNYKSIT